MLSETGLAHEVNDEERFHSAVNTVSLMHKDVFTISSLICFTIVRDVQNSGMKVIHNVSVHKDLASHSEVTVHVSLLCWLGFRYLVTNTAGVSNYIQFPSWIKKCTQ